MLRHLTAPAPVTRPGNETADGGSFLYCPILSPAYSALQRMAQAHNALRKEYRRRGSQRHRQQPLFHKGEDQGLSLIHI